MIYVTSDLHGYPLPQFLKQLNDAGFSKEDELIVLGDVIDRGKDGVRILRWMMQQPNVRLILGNHEDMLLNNTVVFEEVSEKSLSRLTPYQTQLLSNWMYNGAEPTLEALRNLLWVSPESVKQIVDYLRQAPLYEVVRAGGRKFVLVHGGLGNFNPKKPLHRYSRQELLWTRPTWQTHYYDNATVIFGHTPTGYFGPQYRGIAVKTDTWVCIDTGAADGKKPMLLRLDDMQEFYG